MTESKSRRDFLRKAAAAAALASAFGESARGAGDDPADDFEPIPQAQARAPIGADGVVNVGVIGTGGMGTGHCDALARFAAESKAIRVAALCDLCDPRVQNAKTRVDKAQGGDVPTYRRHEDLLARPDIHGVLIASPEHWHARLAEDAIKAGKDVYVEKPMTINLKDALRLRKVVKANPGAIVVVGTQFVMTPSYMAAETLVKEGAIGKPVWSQTSYCRNSKTGEWNYYALDPAWKPGENLDWERWCKPLGKAKWSPEIYARWRRYKKYSSGIIGDLLVHHVTPTLKALTEVGWPVKVVATGGHYIDKAMENPDQININVEFEHDHSMMIAGSTCNELGVERIIRGHKANLFVGGRNAVIRPERIWADEIEEREIPPPPGPVLDPQEALRRHWIDCIRTRQAPRSDVELGTKVMVIVDLAQRSFWEGGAFGFDPRSGKVKRL
ncbi:MAG TPA: Gfo/Idh/MocA family oxidoreductase [Vicinamibacterales bacterium]|jgi:predicted dehydrogenase|nr:Gfo/Idh/MocA family oxidoreductase [Acidobacteriota bacterium]HQX83332.1 Gfo/Idh/MocA family oxidoreductase [Vicinamibacterales bacterium]